MFEERQGPTSAGENAPRRLAGRRQALLSCLALATILVAGAWLRLHRLDEIGLRGSDSVYYTYLAHAWTEGDFVDRVGFGIRVTRPVVIGLFAAALEVFGHTDYAIKLLNASLDTINIALVFTVALFLSAGRLAPARARAPGPGAVSTDESSLAKGLGARDDEKGASGGRGMTTPETSPGWGVVTTTAPATSAALLYGGLPTAIYYARIELTHTISTTLVLLSLLFFLGFVRTTQGRTSPRRARSYLGLAAGIVGLAALSHDELLLLVPAYLVALVLVRPPRRPLRPWVQQHGAELLLFASVAVIVSLPVLLHHRRTSARIARRVLDVEEHSALTLLGPIEEALRYAWSSVLAMSSPVLLVLGLVVVAAALWRATRWALAGVRRPAPLPLEAFLPLGIAAVHLFLFSLAFDFYFARLFLPLFALLLPAVAVLADALLRPSAGRAAPIVMLGATVLVLSFDLAHFSRIGSSDPAGYMKSWDLDLTPRFTLADGRRRLVQRAYRVGDARRVWNRLGARVDDRAKVLVTPHLHDPAQGRRHFQVPYYFGDDAIYAIDHDEPLVELIRTKRIRYVVFANWRLRRGFLDRTDYPRYEYERRWSRAPLHLGAVYGMPPGAYTLEREYEYLIRFLDEQGAGLIWSDPESPPGAGQPSLPLHRVRTLVFALPDGGARRQASR